jgi:hypothetical protein
MNTKTLAVAVSLVVGTSTLADPPQYQIELLGIASDVRDMNALGEVVGGFSDIFSPDMRAYVAGPNHPYELLPLPDGYVRSWANGINDAGVIVGGASITGYPNEHGDGVVWTPNGEGGYDVQVLDHLPGHTGSIAKAINNRGDIIGQSIFQNSGFGPGVWFNAPGGVFDISLIGAPSTLEDINDAGIVVGFNGQLFDIDTLEMVSLPPDPLGLTGLYAINNGNELAGAYGTGNSHGAVRWTDQMGWELIGLSGGQSSPLWAWDINASGVTVADTSGSYPWYFHVAVHFDEFGTLPLESLIAPDQGNWGIFTLTRAAINDAGQIAVIAEDFDTSEYGVALLTPGIPGDVNGDGEVNTQDLLMLLSDWGECAGCPTDLDGDGFVGTADLLELLANWT